MAENKPSSAPKSNASTIRDEAATVLGAFGEIKSALDQITEESGNKFTKVFKQSFSEAKNLGGLLSSLSENQLKNRTRLKELESAASKAQKEIAKVEKEINTLGEKRIKATKSEKEVIDKILRAKQDQLENAQYLVDTAKDLVVQNTKFLNGLDAVNKQLNKIQGVNNLLTLSFFGNQILKISEQTTQFQKSLLLSAEQATSLRNSFTDIANSSGDNFLTTNKLIEANNALSQQLGFAKNFGADLNTEFVNLTKRVGLTEEAAAGFAKASILTGKSMKSIDESSAGIVSSVSSQYGIQLNVRDVMNEAGSASAIMLSNFKGSTTALVEGVAQMKALGTSLEQTNAQAESLLNFESSIESQLKASLLTGRQINLEKARELALNNDLDGLAKELSNQAMSFNEFSNLNRIQQEGIAKALGLSRDTLADQLLKQAVQGKSQSDIIALYGEEAYERSKSLNTQEKLNAAIEKMADLAGNLAAGPLGKMADLLSKVSESTTAVGAALGVVAGVQLLNVINGILKLNRAFRIAGMSAGILKALTNPAGLLLSLAVAGAAGAIISNMMGSEEADDLMSGYGDRTLITPKGAYALNNNDTVIAGTNLFRGNDVYSGPAGALNMTPEIDYNKLASAMSKVQVSANVRVNDIATPVTVYQQQNMRRSV